MSAEERAGALVGEKVLVLPRRDGDRAEFEVLTLGGHSSGTFLHHDNRVSDWWRATHLVDAKIVAGRDEVDGSYLTIQLVAV